MLFALALVLCLLCAGAVYLLLNALPADNPPRQPAIELAGLREVAADDPGFTDIVQKLDSNDVLARVAATKSLTTIKPNEQHAAVAQKLAKLVGAGDPFSAAARWRRSACGERPRKCLC